MSYSSNLIKVHKRAIAWLMLFEICDNRIANLYTKIQIEDAKEYVESYMFLPKTKIINDINRYKTLGLWIIERYMKVRNIIIYEKE